MLKVSAFLKNQEFTAQIEIMRFRAKFFENPTGSRHLGEMKLVPMMKNSGHRGTIQFF